MKKAPDFKLPDQNGKCHSLRDYASEWLVLYFYPKDDTPGCTKEACSFRDEREVIAQLGNAEIVGVSKDSVASHKRFVEKYHLNFTVLSDESSKTIKDYGSLREKTLFGKKVVGTARNTFIINPKGYIAKEYLGVSPIGHAKQIIDDLKSLQAKN
jgi:peroxiredoxin Q/BCP